MDDVVPTTAQTVQDSTAEPLLEAFFTRAEAAPDVLALIGPTDRLTYEQLRAQVLAVAGALGVAGVRAGDRVAVIGPRDAGAVTAILAILAAGGVCVPIDTAAAAEPILERTGVRMALFTGDEPPTWLPALTVSEALRVGALTHDITPARSVPGDPAYLQFADQTGSDAVVITHNAAREAAADLRGRLGADAGVAAFARPAVVQPVLTVLTALTAGVAIVVVDDAPVRSSERRKPRGTARTRSPSKTQISGRRPGVVSVSETAVPS